MTYKTFSRICLVVMWVFFAAVMLSGCYTADKATKQVNKADSKYPEVVAKLARDKYPCTEILKGDTAIIFKDTTIFIDCPDTIKGNDYEVIKFDTINKVVTKTIRVPVRVQLPSQIVTRWYEDSAKLKIAAIAEIRLNKAIENLTADNTKLQKKATRRGYENWIWRLITLCLTAWQVFKIYKRIMIKI